MTQIVFSVIAGTSLAMSVWLIREVIRLESSLYTARQRIGMLRFQVDLLKSYHPVTPSASSETATREPEQ